MALTHIWHQLYLHRQKIGFAVLFVLCLTGTAQAQNQKIKAENKPGYDEKRIRYGFYLGVIRSKYQIEHTASYANTGSAPGIPMNAMWSTGFHPGLVLNVRLFDYLDARFLPGVAFHTRKIDFADPASGGDDGFENDVTMSSTVIELPLLLKYKAKRRGNYRMYMVGGVKGSRIIGDGGFMDTQTRGQRLQIRDTDLAIEYGVGLDIFYPYFKFAPELRFSHGLMNQKADYSSEYSDKIDRLSARTVSLIFHFE